MTTQGKEPRGRDLLATLVKLLAQQEGVEIKAIIEDQYIVREKAS